MSTSSNAATPSPPPLLDGYKTNFSTLTQACRHNDLCLVSAVRKSDQQPVALVCAVNPGEQLQLIPLAVMCEGNPFEDFEDPTVVK